MASSDAKAWRPCCCRLGRLEDTALGRWKTREAMMAYLRDAPVVNATGWSIGSSKRSMHRGISQLHRPPGKSGLEANFSEVTVALRSVLLALNRVRPHADSLAQKCR